MSQYDNPDKDRLYEQLDWFLENYSICDLLEILADVLRQYGIYRN